MEHGFIHNFMHCLGPPMRMKTQCMGRPFAPMQMEEQSSFFKDLSVLATPLNDRYSQLIFYQQQSVLYSR